MLCAHTHTLNTYKKCIYNAHNMLYTNQQRIEWQQVNISNDAHQISGVFIKNIIQSSPAELCKQIKVCVFWHNERFVLFSIVPAGIAFFFVPA